MTDRPIIFSAPMIQALLGGLKTQHRVPLKPQPVQTLRTLSPVPAYENDFTWPTKTHGCSIVSCKPFPPQGYLDDFPLPYAIGDRLWVREAFSYETLDVDRNGFMPPWYWADGNPTTGDFTKPKPSIHMPRWASRLTLTVTDVRVQRLQDISEEDARAEGAVGSCWDDWRDYGGPSTYRPDFQRLWSSIHGPDAWEDNPWVCALTFTVEKRNIDAPAGDEGR